LESLEGALLETGAQAMNRYFFNFRKGDELSSDHVGMYLRNLEEARLEALCTCQDIVLIAECSGEDASDCEIEVADASGERLLEIPCGKQGRERLH